MTRIPSTSFQHRTLHDLRLSLEASARLQRQISSGRRVERPSDDPTAAARILPLVADLRALDRMRANGELAKGVLDLGAYSLEQISEHMTTAREIALQAANTTVGGKDRESLADEVDQLLDQLVSLANAQRGGRYLFGGSVDGTAPFVRLDSGDRTRVVYRGDDRERGVEVGPGIRMSVNFAGDALLQSRARGATRYDGDTGAAAGPPFDTGVGTARLDITFAGLTIPAGTIGLAAGPGETTALGRLDYVFTAPATISIAGGPPTVLTGGPQDVPVGTDGRTLSLDVTLPIAPPTGTLVSEAWASLDGGATRTRIDFGSDRVIVEDPLDESRVHVDVSALASTGVEHLTFAGTFDAFAALIELRDQLRNVDGAPADTVRERLTAIVGALGEAHELVLGALQDLGARSDGLGLLQTRLDTLRQMDEETLSDVRDVDLVEAIAKMEMQNFAYQAALQVSARAIQTSLLDFLA
ncbi:MAG: flagellar hook-associated protein FlgL [Planctomycetes bacterium]|nr:flagellar hook-associated protein FlgL [Planctomycetota bacterium]